MSPRELPLIQSLGLALLLLLTAPLFAKPNVGEPIATSGEYTETVEDMRVKVLGGFITVKRTWKDKRWQINRRWNPLQIVRDPVNDAIKYIERNGDRYSERDLGPVAFVPLVPGETLPDGAGNESSDTPRRPR